MKKILLLFLLCTLSFYGAEAQKPDSVYIHRTYIQLIYQTDSLPLVKELSYDTDSMRMELSTAFRASKSDIKRWRENPHRVFAYSELAFRQSLDSILVGNQLSNHIFFACDRCIIVDEDGSTFTNGHEKKVFRRCYANRWQQYLVDSLSIALIFDASSYMRYGDKIRMEQLIVPLKGNRYFLDSIVTPQPDTLKGSYSSLLWSRQMIFDVDTASVNGRYGLYTLAGREVIPAVYDSIKTDEVYVRAFDGRRTTIFDYMGNVVRGDIKRAYPFLYRYQVLDSNNHVYWLDRDGQEHDTFVYSIMSVDDIIYPLPFDIVLTPPKRKQKKGYHWVHFKYNWDYSRQAQSSYSDDDSWEIYWDKQAFLTETGINTLIDEYDKECFSYLKDLYNNSFDYYRYTNSTYKDLKYYDFDIYEIPSHLKQPLLVSGKDKLDRSGDYRSLDGRWIIAKQKGRYGVVDVRDTEKPVLPFIYDKIEGHDTYLTLYKSGLKSHYPISDTPRYKELAPMRLREYYIRFTLPDGRGGWLLKNGEEFLDNE